MKKAFFSRAPLAVVSAMIMGVMMGCSSSTSNVVNPTAGSAMALREIGSLNVTPRHYGVAPNRSSWITMAAEDERKARVCASKYLEDILGFGEVKIASDPAIPGTLLSLDGAGWWVLGLDGAEFHVVFARSKEELAAVLKTADAAQWQAIPRGAYPKWLDCFDNAAMTFWFSGFGILPTDIPGDLKWYADNQFTLCAVLGNTERRLIAPGVVDTSVMDWYSAIAHKYQIPYKMMADMTQPVRPESLWNTVPLPHVIPAEGHVAYSPFYYQRLALASSFAPVAATDRYMMDFRRRVGEQVKGDPYFTGHHVMQEMSGQSGEINHLAAVAGSPEIQALWRMYLRDILKLDLKAVGRLHYGDADAFTSWAEVPIPAIREFAGWEPDAIDLKGRWEGRADRAAQATAEKWSEDGAPAEVWRPVDSQDLGIMFYGGNNPCDYYLRKTFTVGAEKPAGRFLHVARAGFHSSNSPIYDAWINGQKLKLISNTDPSAPDWDMCFDIGETVKPGENLIVLNCKGMPIPSYVFIGKKGTWVYPGPSETMNRRYFDAIQFEAWLVMRELETRMIAVRAGDPNRPMKVMAPHNYIDCVLDLCAQYGAYPHDTGLAAAIFAPFQYSRYAFTRGIPNSAEEGGMVDSNEWMRKSTTRYLMMGVDMVDMVGHVGAYRKNVNAWITENRELLRCIGKLDLVPPVIGVLRSGRELRLGIRDVYQWDLGRGGLSAIGRAFNYAELGDLKSGRVNQFKILIDCATNVLSEDEVDALERYVRQGGIFVAFHNTGMHTPEKAYAWPISRLTGLRVLNENRPVGGKKIRFGDTQDLFPKLRGQELDGWGLVMDWMKQDRTGTPVAMMSQGKDVQVIAEWQDAKMDGAIAVACRTLGKGKVITLGSTFWRNAKDQSGRYEESGTMPYLDELLTSLGAPRESMSGDLWVERWRSKNGVYDVYPVAQMNQDAVPVTIDVKIRRDTPAAPLWELSALQHPVYPAGYADGMLTIPQVTMEAMQSRVFAAPRRDIEDAALHWLEEQGRYWGKLPEISVDDKKRATVEPAADVIPLVEGWQGSSGEKDLTWVKPADTSAKAWKTVKLGSFAAMGLPEDAVAQFRKEVKLPASWNGQRVTLFFNAEHWFWGIGLRGRLWINGEPAAVKQPLQPSPNGSFVIELTPEQLAQQPLVIALEVDGRQMDKNQGNRRPTGVTGEFFLHVAPPPVQVLPLTQWALATELNQLTPTAVGQAVEGMYLETKFTLPAQWPARRLYVKSPVCLGSLFINNQYVAAPAWMQELDVSGLVLREGENVLRWVPENPEPSWKNPYKGNVPELNLMWTE